MHLPPLCPVALHLFRCAVPCCSVPCASRVLLLLYLPGARAHARKRRLGVPPREAAGLGTTGPHASTDRVAGILASSDSPAGRLSHRLPLCQSRPPGRPGPASISPGKGCSPPIPPLPQEVISPADCFARGNCNRENGLFSGPAGHSKVWKSNCREIWSLVRRTRPRTLPPERPSRAADLDVAVPLLCPCWGQSDALLAQWCRAAAGRGCGVDGRSLAANAGHGPGCAMAAGNPGGP